MSKGKNTPRHKFELADLVIIDEVCEGEDEYCDRCDTHLVNLAYEAVFHLVEDAMVEREWCTIH